MTKEVGLERGDADDTEEDRGAVLAMAYNAVLQMCTEPL
jgi:hypothetical protein